MMGVDVDLPSVVVRMPDWNRSFSFQIIPDEPQQSCHSESSSEESNATSHVSATESEDDIDSWVWPIPLPLDFKKDN